MRGLQIRKNYEPLHDNYIFRRNAMRSYASTITHTWTSGKIKKDNGL
jgi:hypothetical protein